MHSTDTDEQKQTDTLRDFELEKAVLGDCSLDSAYLAAHRAAGVNEECFVLPLHQRVFRELCKLEADGVQFNEANLYESLSKSTLDSLGGDTGLTDMQSRAGMRRAFIEVDVKRLLDLARRRRYRDAAKAYAEALERGEGVEAAQSALQEIQDSNANAKQEKIVSMRDAAMQAYDELQAAMKAGGLTGATTGFPTLDRLTGGLQHGQYYVVGARCGVGKTALALNISLAAAKSGKRVLFITAEMPPYLLASRLISSLSMVDLQKRCICRDGVVMKSECKKIMEAVKVLKEEVNIDFLEAHGESVEELSAKIRAAHRRAPLGLMVVDYLQILDSEAPRANASATENVAAVSLTLRNLAKAIDVPMLVLAQLNRESAKSAPTLAELKQSGQIEQDADMVLLLDRKEKRLSPDADDKERKALRGQATLHVAKNRHGVADETIPLLFIGEHYTFTEE